MADGWLWFHGFIDDGAFCPMFVPSLFLVDKLRYPAADPEMQAISGDVIFSVTLL
jgi:hypothetical protein